MKTNREDVVQAALTVERWCAEHIDEDIKCDCPFAVGQWYCMLIKGFASPREWNLEKRLSTRGLKHDD